jgi:hypothetical protein
VTFGPDRCLTGDLLRLYLRERVLLSGDLIAIMLVGGLSERCLGVFGVVLAFLEVDLLPFPALMLMCKLVDAQIGSTL